MDNTEFDTRLDRVRRTADVVSSLPKQLQAGAFAYLLGNIVVAESVPAQQAAAPVVDETPPDSTLSNDADPTVVRKTRRRNGSRSPKGVAHDTQIDLFPEGKQSFKDFATEKAPSSNDERYAVAVYWILRVAGLPTATVAQVMSCFMAVDWRLPSDPVNAGSQSRKAGFLSSAKSEDLQVSSIGMNLVKSDLPRTKT